MFWKRRSRDIVLIEILSASLVVIIVFFNTVFCRNMNKELHYFRFVAY